MLNKVVAYEDLSRSSKTLSSKEIHHDSKVRRIINQHKKELARNLTSEMYNILDTETLICNQIIQETYLFIVELTSNYTKNNQEEYESKKNGTYIYNLQKEISKKLAHYQKPSFESILGVMTKEYMNTPDLGEKICLLLGSEYPNLIKDFSENLLTLGKITYSAPPTSEQTKLTTYSPSYLKDQMIGLL